MLVGCKPSLLPYRRRVLTVSPPVPLHCRTRPRPTERRPRDGSPFPLQADSLPDRRVDAGRRALPRRRARPLPVPRPPLHLAGARRQRALTRHLPAPPAPAVSAGVRRGRFPPAIAAVATSAAVAGGVYAAGGPKDEAALEPARPAASKNVEKRVDALLRKMTTEEKLQQVQLLSDGQMNEEGGARGDREAKAGVGGVFSLVDPVKINHFQKVAVEQSRLGIPILFAYDTIHGFRTIFPI